MSAINTAHPLSPDPAHPLSPDPAPDPSTDPTTSNQNTMTSSMTQSTLAPTLAPSGLTSFTHAPGGGGGGKGKFDRFESPAGAFPTSRSEGWEEAWERQRRERWRGKVEGDLRGWRGGNGTPRSDYSREAVPSNSYYGQPVTGQIGRHLPKEIVRIERDWSDGEVCQFESSFPMELEGRMTPQEWTTLISHLNAHLVQAYSVRGAVIDNVIAIATWWTSLSWRTSHFERYLSAAEKHIDEMNKTVLNKKGLNVLSPREVALQFLEIE